MDQKLFLQNLIADLAQAGALTTAVSSDVSSLLSNGSSAGTPNLQDNISLLQSIIDQNKEIANDNFEALPTRSPSRIAKPN